MVRLLLVILALVGGIGAAGAASPPAMRLWVEVDHAGPIHPQEQVLLRVKGRFMVPITLEKMEDPPLDGFRSVRIDRDRWSDVFEDGLTQRAFERVIAVFPQRSGRLVVPPFVHHLTVVNAAMKQVKTDLASAPVTIDVVPATAPADSWWIAAAELTVADSWSKDPAALDIGQSTRRTITIAAKGVFDDQLPPAPAVKAEGLIVFPGNAERVTRIGLGRAVEVMALREEALRKKGRLEEVATRFSGPISEVSYTYDIRPATGSPVALPDIRIPWYDTVARTMRFAVLPGRTVALKAAATDTGRLEAALGITADGVPAGDGGGPRLGVPLLVLTAGIAFVVAFSGLAAALRPPVLTAAVDAVRAARRRRRLLRAVRTAARTGDAVATRRALLALAAAGDGAIAERSEAAVAVIDRHLFAPRHERPADLVGLTARIG